MTNQGWNSTFDFVLELLLTLVAGTILIGFTTLLISLLLLSASEPTAMKGLKIFLSSALFSGLLLYSINRMTELRV